MITLQLFQTVGKDDIQFSTTSAFKLYNTLPASHSTVVSAV